MRRTSPGAVKPARAAGTRRSGVTGLLSGAGLLVLVVCVVGLFIGRQAQQLATGESATVQTVERCADGGGPGTEPSHCEGEWEFADGRTSMGDIQGPQVAEGDTVFAGSGWAYASQTRLSLQVWIPVGLCTAFIGVAVAFWVILRRDQRALLILKPAPIPGGTARS
ncbi:hypothetical protein [Streptomyces zagrosensis]|uniref:Uncharacterized protein n=1 Tax=Streptomyces zagrosensis TaxID=1042984 RepID=A0A7W9UZD6_9ACTN|nr:hypothetical protein [Streptomyces zagrosensis]MBB5936903.1 hypothetical protein [Streptomyces zagrosensis]